MSRLRLGFIIESFAILLFLSVFILVAVAIVLVVYLLVRKVITGVTKAAADKRDE